MKKLSLLILALGLFLSGFSQNENLSKTVGEMLLADDALVGAIKKVDANTIKDAAGQLEYHLSYVIGERAATIPDFRKVFFSSQCKYAMTAVVQEFDNSGLTAELLRIAPDFLDSYAYADNAAFVQKLSAALEPYYITPDHITSDLPAVVEAQARFVASKVLPVSALVSEGMLPLLEKCLNTDQNEVVQNEAGYIVHPFTMGTHPTKKGYAAGGALIVIGLNNLLDAAKAKDPVGMTQAMATMMAVWVNVPGEMNF